MPTTTITAKGQMTLPKGVRDALGLKRGDKVRFFKRRNANEYIMEPVTMDIKELEGCLPKPKKAVSLEEMQGAIAKRKRV